MLILKPTRRAIIAMPTATVVIRTPIIEATSSCPPREYSSMRTDKGRVFAVTRRIVVLMSRSAAIRTMAKMLIRVGVISGNEIRQKVVKRPAPQANDASSNSLEICARAVFII